MKKSIILLVFAMILVFASCGQPAAESADIHESSTAIEGAISSVEKEVVVTPFMGMVEHSSLKEVVQDSGCSRPYIVYGTIKDYGKNEISEIVPHIWYHEVIIDVKQWIKGEGGDQFTYRAFGGESDTTVYAYEMNPQYPPVEPVGQEILVIAGPDLFVNPGELILIAEDNGIVHAEDYLMINGKLEAVDISMKDLIALIQSYLT